MLIRQYSWKNRSKTFQFKRTDNSRLTYFKSNHVCTGWSSKNRTNDWTSILCIHKTIFKSSKCSPLRELFTFSIFFELFFLFPIWKNIISRVSPQNFKSKLAVVFFFVKSNPEISYKLLTEKKIQRCAFFIWIVLTIFWDPTFFPMLFVIARPLVIDFLDPFQSFV